jgi:cytochrome bd-type quinol oxidase subunit 2
MRIRLRPKTIIGRWSVGLTIILIIFFVLFQLLVASGQRGGETFFDNLALTIPILLAGISGVSAFVTGIIGIIKSRERSFLVFLTTTIGFFVLVFCLGEFLFPH